jgi:hypothetical protein
MALTRIPAGGVVTATTFTFNSLNVTATTVTASTITGALVISGGMAAGGNAYIGGNLTVLGTINATITGVASSATNIAGGTVGQVPYQTGIGATSFYGPGTAGQILLSNGASAPVYTNTASVYVGAATSAVNLFGGTPGQLHYQTAAGTTAFLSTGTTGQLLVSAAGAPVWTNTSSLYVQDANVSTNLRAGTAGQLVYQTGANATGFISTATTGNFLQANYAGVPTWTSTANMYVAAATSAVNLFGGSAGQFAYQTGAGATAFVSTGSMYVSRAVFADSASGSAGSVANALTIGTGLSGTSGTYNGSAAVTISLNTATLMAIAVLAQTATTATNAGTAYATIGTHSTGTGIFGASFNGSANQTWTLDTSTLMARAVQTVQGLSTGTGIFGGTFNGSTAQTWSLNTATLMQVSTQVVQSLSTGTGILGNSFNGSTAQTWTLNTATLMANAVTAINLAGGSANQFAYQTGAGATAFASTGSMYVGRAVLADSVSGSAGSLVNAVTFNNGGAGDASGTSYNGGAARTVSYNTLGAMPTSGGTFSGPVTFTQPVTFSGTATYVLSTNTFYTDNIIELHVPPAGVNAPWFADDGKDIGLRFHYYANSTDTNAALVLDNTTKYLDWYSSGAESASGDFSTATFGVFRTGSIKLVTGTQNQANTSTGDLTVLGGVGVGGSVFVGGIVTATTFVGALSFSHSAGAGLTGSAYNGSAAQTWTLNTSTLMANAVTATNLAGGSANQFAYQTGAGATAFSSTGSMYVGRAVIADSVSGSAGSLTNALTTGTGLLFDSGTTFNGSAARTISLNTTTLVQVATQVVQSHTAGTGLSGSTFNGSAAVTWTLNTATLMAASVTATNLAGGTAGQFAYQTGPGATSFVSTGSMYVNRAVIADSASGGSAQVNTVAQPSSATYYPVFVNANNASAAAMSVYTTSTFLVNPATGQVGINTAFLSTGSKLTVYGRVESVTDGTGTEGGQFVMRSPGFGYRWSIDNYYGAFRIIREDDVTEANGASIVTITSGTSNVFVVGGLAGYSGEKFAVNGGAYVNGTLTATTFVGAFSGSITGASTQVNTQAQTASGTYYPVFVSGNNASATAMSEYTTSTFTINPATGVVGINGVGGTALNISVPSTVVDRYFINATAAVNSFSIYDNANTPYINSYAGMTFRANQIGGTGGTINFSGGNVYVANSLGVGTASPNTKLDVRFAALSSTTQLNHILLQSLADGANNQLGARTGITFNNRTVDYVASGGTSTAGVYGVSTDNNVYARSLGLVFYTSTLDAAATEKLRITSAGGIAFGGAANYGTSGQILQSNGDAAPTWVNVSSLSATDSTKLPLAGGTMTGNILFGDSGTTKRGIQGTVGANDFWFVGGGATASNSGWMEIATGDDAQSAGSNTAEPIMVSQYGPGDPLTGTLYSRTFLATKAGNTTFPNNFGIGFNKTTAPYSETEPGAKLHVTTAAGANAGVPATSGTTFNGIARFQPNYGTYGESLDFGFNVSTSYGWIQATNYTNLAVNYPLLLNPNGGNVGIGNVTPASTLDIYGLQANTGATSANTPTGTLRLAYAGSPGAGTFGSSLVFSQQWYSGSPTAQVAVGQITGVKIASDGSFGGGLAFWTSNATANSLAERLRITNNGGFSFGASGTAYGSSGQILQSNGDAAPTWVNASGITSGATSLTNTYVGFGSGSNLLTGSSSLTWNGTTLYVNGRLQNAGGLKTYSVSTSGQGNVNAVYEIMKISRDSVNWSANISYEITVYSSYYTSGGYAKYLVTYGYSDSGTIVCTYSAGGGKMRIYLGTEVSVNANCQYKPVFLDIPPYMQSSIEVRYNTSEVGSVGAINSSGQVFFSAIMTASGGTGAFYSGDIHLVPSGGNVAIGNGATAGAARLHVVATAATGLGGVPSGVTALMDSNTNNYLLFRQSADNSTYSGIAFQDNNVGGYVLYGNGGVGDQLWIAGYGGGSLQAGTSDTIDRTARTTYLSWSGSGVGITNGPLTLNTNRLYFAAVNDNNHALNYPGGTFNSQTNGTQFRWYNYLNLYSTSGGISVMHLNDSGNVGIGTVSPTAKLHIAAAADGDSVFKINGQGGTNATVKFADVDIGGQGYGGAYLAWGRGGSYDTWFMVYTRTSGNSSAERLRITANGGVAFGGGSNYGASGQILQSNGDAAPTWVTPSGLSAGSVANAVTFNNSNTGDASGTTYNGSAARTISANTIGATPMSLSRFAGDLNTLGVSNATSGIYDIGSGYTNGPAANLYGTLQAYWNNDIAIQFWHSYNGDAYWRKSVGNTFTGSVWRTLIDSSNIGSYTAGSASLTSNYVGYGSGSNTLTGSSSLTWNGSNFYINGTLSAYAPDNTTINFSNADSDNATFTNRNSRVLTSNGANWVADGTDPILTLTRNNAGTTRGKSIGLLLHNENNTTNSYSPLIGFSALSNSGGYNSMYAAIMGKKTGANAGVDSNWNKGELHFYTCGDAYMADTPTAVLTSGGFGFNTTAPALTSGFAGINVVNAGYTQMRVQSSASSAGIEFKPSTGKNWELQGTNSNNFILYNRTDGVYRLVVQANGNVSVGYNNDSDQGYNLAVSGSLYVGSNTNSVAGYNVRTSGIANLSALSTTQFYPVVFPCDVFRTATRFRIQVDLNSNVPSWGTHPGGFSINLDWSSNGSGWGTIGVSRVIHNYAESWTNQTICGGITQYTNSSYETVYLRGGGNYYWETDGSAATTPTIYTASTVINGQTIAPISSPLNTPMAAGQGNQGFGNVNAAGEITAYYSSDKRLKENIRVIDSAMGKVEKLRGVYFDWTEENIKSRGGADGYFVRKEDVGVIAQEVQEVLPEIVAERTDGYLAVKYEKLVPLLIEAMKEQQQQIAQLQDLVNSLVNK